jgi:large subunit ribosomal protein L10
MVAVAKTLNETAKKTKILSIKGGILQGTPLAADQVVELASLPPADVLQGQVLGAIVGPLTSIVGLFAAPVQDFVGLLDARIDQLGGPDAAPAAEAEAPTEAAEAGEAEAPAAEAEAPAEASAETEETSEETADEAADQTEEEE